MAGEAAGQRFGHTPSLENLAGIAWRRPLAGIMPAVRAEILTVGDELCRGETIDTNGAHLASELWERQVTVAWMTSCRDLAEDVRDALEVACSRADVVLVSGGLGPTDDDLTVDVVCGLVGGEAVIDPVARQRLEARFAVAGAKADDSALRQVRVPASSRVFDNSVGLAPGFEVELGSAHVICLPGPPAELRAVFTDGVADRLIALREARGQAIERIARRIYRVFGRGESAIVNMLEGLELPAAASLHYQVRFPETLVKVVVRDRDLAQAQRSLDVVDRQLRDRLGVFLYGVDDDSLAAVLGRELTRQKLTIATAESCTGGMVGQLLTSVSGSSDYYLGGAVTYSNAEKTRQLGVRPATLDAEGAVSEACVVEMARGARDRIGADVAVAISGVAGPSGGSDEKPVGTVWIAVSGPGDRQRSKRFVWPGDRERIRVLAAYWALALLRRSVQSEEV